MFKPKAIYFEKEIEKYELGKQLLEKYKETPKVEIENHNNIEEMRKKQNKEFINMKRNLIIGVRKTHKFVENHKTSDYLVPYTSSGCTAACMYCYLVCNYNKCAYLRLFVNREQMLDKIIKVANKAEKELNFWLNNAIKGVTEDAEKMQFNTAIARMMEFINALSKYMKEETKNLDFLNTVCESFIKILAPFAPHFAEEQWSLLTNKYSVFTEAWPEFDAKALVKDEVEIAIQINGKIKARINVASDLNEEEIKSAALADEAVLAATEGKTIVKVIVIKGRLVNIVVK